MAAFAKFLGVSVELPRSSAAARQENRRSSRRYYFDENFSSRSEASHGVLHPIHARNGVQFYFKRFLQAEASSLTDEQVDCLLTEVRRQLINCACDDSAVASVITVFNDASREQRYHCCGYLRCGILNIQREAGHARANGLGTYFRMAHDLVVLGTAAVTHVIQDDTGGLERECSVELLVWTG
jgi:hypothetical protein